VFLEDGGEEFVEEWSVPSHFDLGVRCPDRLVILDAFAYFYQQVIDQPMKKVGDCYVDLGANMGAYTMGAMRSGYEKIVAVEPVPKLARFLQDTFRGKVNVVPKAVWSSAGEERLWFRDDLWGGDAHLSEAGEPVATTTLDDLLTGLDRVHLKMDIEGAEEEVVLATSSDTWGKVVRIDLEVHEWKCDVQKIAEHLRAKGFSVSQVYTLYVNEGIVSTWECTRLEVSQSLFSL
jgi:FkbM family methyltransferase